VLSESLQECSNDHGEGADHNTPAASILAVDPWHNGDSENGAELVTRADETEDARLNGPLAFGIFVSISEVCLLSEHAV
jgi:hypothetical protein